MSKRTRRVGVIGFDGANALDIVGPLEAFANAGQDYDICVMGLSGTPFSAESGVRFVPRCRLDEAPKSIDTLIVPGGVGLRDPKTNSTVSSWLLNHAPRSRRVATVCTGIYGLAPTGLLDGRWATTHWRFTEDVALRFPRVHVQRNALFVKDGPYYTSAGITAGIDLALALIEEDLGPRRALAVARELVVYLKRPGGQEQYSEPLRFQSRSQDSFADLVAWICAHFDHDLSVESLAARVGLSPRHFHRRFTAAIGRTPAEFVEIERLREARDRLTGSRLSIERIANSLGFGSADVFRRRFEHRFGITPRTYRERFASAGPARAKSLRDSDDRVSAG